MSVYFYARVSTKEQNLARQLEAAKEYREIDQVFADKESGKNFDRPEYQRMKGLLLPGDEVLVKSLDRLGRNKEATKEEIKWFKHQGVTLRVLDLPTSLIDFHGQEWIGDMVNNILIEVIASFAEEERRRIRERQREGIDAMPVVNGKRVSAKRGTSYGRPVIEMPEFENLAQKQKDGLLTVGECCKMLGISRSTWYNRMRNVGA